MGQWLLVLLLICMESVLVCGTCRKCLMKWDGIDYCAMDLNDCWLLPKWKAIEALDLLRKMQTVGLRPNKVKIHLLVTSLWKYCSIDAWKDSPKDSPLLFHQNWNVQQCLCLVL